MRIRTTALVLSVALALGSCDWQMRLGGIEHRSASIDGGLSASGVARLGVKWRVAYSGCAGAGASSGFVATPVTFNGVVYISGLSGCVYAISERDGAPRWSRFMGY